MQLYPTNTLIWLVFLLLVASNPPLRPNVPVCVAPGVDNDDYTPVYPDKDVTVYDIKYKCTVKLI